MSASGWQYKELGVNSVLNSVLNSIQGATTHSEGNFPSRYKCAFLSYRMPSARALLRGFLGIINEGGTTNLALRTSPAGRNLRGGGQSS